MRKQIVCVVLALALCALSVGAASAKVKIRTLTFGRDFWVSDTLVKKGTYKVAYDDKTGEVTISDKQEDHARQS
jgi:ABC-type proline/glycine betaine transport system substrate-binding protein